VMIMRSGVFVPRKYPLSGIDTKRVFRRKHRSICCPQ
jgi:hypothetical protein